MKSLSRSLALVVSIAALTSGCALKPVQVTGKEVNGSQSETFAMSRFGDVARLTVTYNDGTDQNAVQYTATTRVAKKGATHLGWSNSNDYGATWSYGGRGATNDDWPILWGDPGITNSVRDQHYVYIVSLAIPKAKLDGAPGGEVSGPVAKFAVTACVDEKPCNGAGFRLEDGSIVCACFQVRGDCDADTFCHARSRQCIKRPDDKYHVQ